MTHRTLIVTTLSLVLAAACASTPAPTADAEPRKERPADGGVADSQPEADAARIERPQPEAGLDASSACNDVVQAAVPVAATADPGAPPAPTGGVLVDGEYLLTAVTMYGTTLLPPTIGRMTVRIAGNTFSQVTTTNDGESRANFQMSVAGDLVTLTQTCAFQDEPAGGAFNGKLSASSAGFKLLFAEGGITAEQTFARK